MKISSSFFTFSRSEITQFFSCAQLKKKVNGLKLLQTKAEDSSEFGKLLIITPRASGNACERNRLRRRIKAIFYEQELYKHKFISAIIASKSATHLSFQRLTDFLLKNIPPEKPHDQDKA